MAISIQTNASSLIAQENLRVNTNFQAQTIQRLTSGYRINSSGDDAAGLAVANKFRSDTAELMQGVRNANDGISQLQIIDGGLANISKILDRMKTLATQSGSDTFTGNRATLNNEFQTLVKEIDRQASNIGLVNNGAFNKNISVYLGGGSTQSNAQVSVDLSGIGNTVDSAGLGVGSSSIDAGGTTMTGNLIKTLNDSSRKYLAAGAGTTQTFAFNLIDSAGARKVVNAVVTSGTSTTGITASDALKQLNDTLSTHGISAAANSSGELVFGGTRAFSVTSSTISSGTDGIATGTSTATNKATYRVMGETDVADIAAGTEVFSITNGSVSKNITLSAAGTLDENAVVDAINAQTASMGIYALVQEDGQGVVLESTGSFTFTKIGSPTAAAEGAFGNVAAGSAATTLTPDTTATATGNALSAIDLISRSVSQLGTVQGRVGTAQNQLGYAINLAQSQISNFSAAESRIRDTDVASEAANLTKASVLSQASMAAMAQANSAPQAVLALLRG